MNQDKRISSFILLSLLVFSILFSLPIFDFSPTIEEVYADASDSGLNYFTNSIDVSFAVTGSYQNVDCSSHIPEGATGVILDLINTDAVNDWSVFARHPDSTDDYYRDIDHDAHFWAVVGVDSSRIFEAKIEDATIDIYLMGYTDSFVQLFDDAKDYSIVPLVQWTDVDVSGDVPEAVPGVIGFMFSTDGLDRDFGVRKNGSTDNRVSFGTETFPSYFMIGIDAGREFEVYITHANVDTYLVGYISEQVAVFSTNADDVSMVAGAGEWTDYDVTEYTEAGATGVILECHSHSPDLICAFREDGSTDARIPEVNNYNKHWYGCGLGAGEIYEHYGSSGNVDVFLIGYFKEGVSPPVNDACESDDPFYTLITDGWINVTVSDLDGVSDLLDVNVTITYSTIERIELSWVQSSDIFSKVSDTNRILILDEETVREDQDADTTKLCFNVRFYSNASIGYYDVEVTSTDDDTNEDNDTYANEFYVSRLLEVDQELWSKNLGQYETIPSVDIDEAGQYAVVGIPYLRQVHLYNRSGDLIWNFTITDSYIGVYGNLVAISGDGSKILVAKNLDASNMNVTLYDRVTQTIDWTEAVLRIARDLSINYDGSVSAVVGSYGSDGFIRCYDEDGLNWEDTNYQYDIPSVRCVEVSRDGMLLVMGTEDNAYYGASIFLYWTNLDIPIWVHTPPQTLPVPSIGAVKISSYGYYIAWAGELTAIYSNDFGLNYYTSSTPLFTENATLRLTHAHQLGMVAERINNEYPYGIHIVVTGLLGSPVWGNMTYWVYNVTSDTLNFMWNRTQHGASTTYSSIDISQFNENEIYYICSAEANGVYYFRTTSSTPQFYQYNASEGYYYNCAMDNDGGNFITSSRPYGENQDIFIQFFGNIYVVIPALEDFSISNMEGCGNWIFSDERYYDFVAEYSHPLDAENIDIVGIYFSDGLNTMYLYYNNSARDEENYLSFSYDVDPILDEDNDPMDLYREGSSAIIVGEYDLIVTWNVWITSYIFDIFDVDVYGYAIDIDGESVGWELLSTDYFHIYDIGGLTNSSSYGDAGQYQGQSPWDVYASNGSAIYVERYDRKLTDVQLQYGVLIPDAYIDYPYNYSLNWGMDFCFVGDDNWYHGFMTEIQSHGGSEIVTGNNRWINYTVEHYRATGNEVAMWEPMAQAKMYAYWEGFDSGQDRFQLHTNLWFSESNASRMYGLRVNSVFFGMKNDAQWGFEWLFGSDWRALDLNMTDLTWKGDIRDYSDGSLDDIRHTKEIVMCRFWLNLSRPEGESYYVRVRDYGHQNFNKLSKFDPFIGIDNPPIIPTIVPHFEQGGFLSTFFFYLLDGFAKLREAVGIGLLGAWGVFVAFLDTVFSFAGWENGFSIIITWIGSLLDWVVLGVTYLFSMLTTLFQLMSVWLVLGITQFISLGSGLVVIYDNLVWMYAEASSGWVDISEIVVPLLPLLPLGYFVWLFNSDDVEGLMRKVMLSWNLVRTVVGFFIQIGQYFIQLVSAIIEAVPVAE